MQSKRVLNLSPVVSALLLLTVGICSVAACNDFMTKDLALGFVEETSSTSSSSSSSGGTSPDDDDADGLSNEVEDLFEMDSRDSDEDHDGFADGLEFVVDSGDPLTNSIVPSSLNRVRNLESTDVQLDSLDSDQDGLGNNFEEENSLDKDNPDTDSDGYSDGLELVANSDPFRSDIRPTRDAPPAPDGVTRTGTAPRDGDGDGISDDRENSLGSESTQRDSDDDGFDDGLEYLMGSDPQSAASIPNFSIPEPPEVETTETTTTEELL